VNLTERDRKIVLILVPVIVLVGYWFLLLAPKRDQLATASAELTKQEERRDAAQAQVTAAESSKSSFAADYASLVKLGKAVPVEVDMPTVMVQLEAAAQGTGIKFARIATGERDEAATATTPQPPAAPGSGDGSQPAAAGGAPAQSAPGGATEAAGTAVNNANGTPAPADGAQPGSAASAGAGAATGLDSMPLELTFQGQFFRLADFFHAMKRFVRVANDRLEVRGRLLTIDSLSFESNPELFPTLKVDLTATIYLASQAQGATGGATPQGPAGPPTPAGAPPADGSTPASSNPTATATP
jgi:Tfp pilus assembly protein PilO